MNLILFVLGALFFAGALWTISNALQGPRRFVDKDLDGAPDEPDGPARDL